MKRSASAQWRGGLKEGQGSISSESGTLSNINYSFQKRFGDMRGTNPEELIAAAHSACFSMALSGELEKRKLIPETIDVKAEVSLEKVADSWSITTSHLNVMVNVPGASQRDVEEAAQTAKLNCPVSRLLKANITMDFHLAREQSAMM